MPTTQDSGYVRVVATVHPQVVSEAISAAPAGIETPTAVARYALSLLAGRTEDDAMRHAVGRPSMAGLLSDSRQ